MNSFRHEVFPILKLKAPSFTLLIFATLFILVYTYAHPGGHYQQDQKEFFNSWSLKNGQIVIGNFYKVSDNNLYLENARGVFTVPLSELTEQDEKLASFKMERILKLNTSSENSLSSGNKKVQSFYFSSMVLVFALIFLFRKKSRVMLVFFGAILIYACTKSVITTDNSVGLVIPKTRISFLDSAFNNFKPSVSTQSDNQYYYVASTGIPSHNMMVGITNWQQQVPIPQAYTGNNSWSIPLQPEFSNVPLSTRSNLMKGAVAIAVNGIPIFNALNNRGEDSYLIGELDNWGGHCGRADDYHYHAAPMHLMGNNAVLPIAFALDGFAIYGSKEPDGTSMLSLDTCHGHSVNNGVYHYHGTTNYPYVVGAMRGKVSLDPTTPAPENQILPQAFAKAARQALTPLKGAVITDFKSNGTNGYSLTYKIGTKYGYVNYSWDASNKFTYTLIDTSGVSTTNTYQR